MGFFPILLMIAFVAIGIASAKKKKQEQDKREAAKRAAAAQDAQKRYYTPVHDDRFPDTDAPRTVQNTPAHDDRFPDLDLPLPVQKKPPVRKVPAAPTVSGSYVPRGSAGTSSMKYISSEGGGSTVSMAYSSSEGAGPVGSMSYATTEGTSAQSHERVNTLLHTVRPLTESSHAHMESSMTGFESCEGDAADAVDAEEGNSAAYTIDAPRTATLPYGLEVTRSAVLSGILYSEILAKPKALR